MVCCERDLQAWGQTPTLPPTHTYIHHHPTCEADELNRPGGTMYTTAFTTADVFKFNTPSIYNATPTVGSTGTSRLWPMMSSGGPASFRAMNASISSSGAFGRGGRSSAVSLPEPMNRASAWRTVGPKCASTAFLGNSASSDGNTETREESYVPSQYNGAGTSKPTEDQSCRGTRLRTKHWPSVPLGAGTIRSSTDPHGS
jgi:hypothetical protein